MFHSIFTSLVISSIISLPVLGASVAGLPRAPANVQSIRVGDHIIQTVTRPVSADRLVSSSRGTSPAVARETTLTKRVTNNCCTFGCPTITCTNGLSTSPDAPLDADCVALSTALRQLAQSEVTNTFPCTVPNASCPNFTVPPGFEQAYFLGTCLVGFINLNSAGGPSESYCHYLMAGVTPTLFGTCVNTQLKTGGFCLQSNPGFAYALEVRHVDV
ncbi:hypothetical protein ONZ45_g6434 [Pleurotus djamor]|nr:hypothetical protein ONZ45_g6434 [Pleurotus djamor]